MQRNSLLYIIIFAIIGLVVVLNIVVIGTFLARQRNASGTPYNELYAITTPVHALKGTVQGVGNNSFTIEVAGESSTTFQVDVTDKTFFSENEVFVPTLLNRSAPPSPRTVTLANVKKGQLVIVGTIEDMRQLKNGKITADTVSLIPPPSALSGVVERVSGSVFTVKGTLQNPFPSVEATPEPAKTYTVAVTSKTEIVGIAGTVQKLNINELKNGMPVTVFFTPGQSGNSVTAVAIQTVVPASAVISAAPADTATQPSTPSANPAP